MNSGLTSTLSDFSKRSEFAKNPLSAEATDESAGPADRVGLMARMRGWRDSILSAVAIRTVLAFAVGIAATLAWQSYSNAARTTIAGWSPRLAWLAPAPAGPSREQIRATSQALTSVRQSVDKLATEIGKLEAQGSSNGASTSTSTPTSSSSRRGSRR
jgi:hypothetical protein